MDTLSVAGRCPFLLTEMSGPLTSFIFCLDSACFHLFSWILSPRRHVRTHSHSVDVGHVSGEGLPAHAVADVPQLGGGVAGSWDEGLVVWTERQAHHVPSVAGKGGGLLARLYVPQCTARSGVHDLSFVTKQAPFIFFFSSCADRGGSCESLPGGVSWARQNLVVVEEAAAGQVTWRWTEVSHQRKKARWAATELISLYSAALSKFKTRVVSWQGTLSPWSAGQFSWNFFNLFIHF